MRQRMNFQSPQNFEENRGYRKKILGDAMNPWCFMAMLNAYERALQNMFCFCEFCCMIASGVVSIVLHVRIKT